MGSATESARATLRALSPAEGGDLATAASLLEAARVLAGSPQLRSALADATAPASAREAVVRTVFGGVAGPEAVGLLVTAVTQRWSSASDLVDGIEELGIRAASAAVPDVDLERELFQIGRTVAANPGLELALGTRIGSAAAKADLVRSLLQGQASEAAVLVVSALIHAARGRRVRQLLSWATEVVADQRGRTVATVTSAVPLTPEQRERLMATLSARYGADISVNAVVDPALVGGLRVQVADDLIDASVAGRIAELRQRLAG
jgi:F-type H+-transporting ATPase subunit delta